MKKIIIPLITIALFALYFAVPTVNSDDNNALEFSHKLHVADVEIECVTCHGEAEDSESGADNLLPDKNVCLDCHDADAVGDPGMLPAIEKYSVLFSHQKHLANGVECESCHSQVAQKEAVGEYILPQMGECLDCHSSRAVSNECATCHLPSENLMPVSHTPGFTHNHGDLARNEATQISANMDCSTCHKQQFCQNCHEGDNLDRTSHPLNYQFTHALDAQGKEKECAVCHTERRFCVECHRDFQVMPQNHTVGWANRFPGDGGRHRVEALNDLEACIACHEQNAQQICQPCHDVNK